MHIEQRELLRAQVERAVNSVKVTDMHTHLFSPAFGDLLLWGIDETINYHYLISETLRVNRMPYEKFWAMPKTAQAEIIWKTIFLENSPISSATSGVLNVLSRLGLNMQSRDINEYRAYFKKQTAENHVTNVLSIAGVKDVVMTNDPFDAAERACWDKGVKKDGRFHTALRFDVMLSRWPESVKTMKPLGYKVTAQLSKGTIKETRRFIMDWIKRTGALYMAASLSPDFNFPEKSVRGTLIKECILPAASEANIPFALMIGVKRRTNPGLTKAGDTLGRGNVEALERLCKEYPNNKFMATMLSFENQHELTVLARKFRNLMVFGCWWFLNVPTTIDFMTRMRLDLLGTSFIAQNSDCRIIDQLIYKWDVSRRVIAPALCEKYIELAELGWIPTEKEINRDVEMLFGGNFWEFVKK